MATVRDEQSCAAGQENLNVITSIFKIIICYLQSFIRVIIVLQPIKIK